MRTGEQESSRVSVRDLLTPPIANTNEPRTTNLQGKLEYIGGLCLVSLGFAIFLAAPEPRPEHDVSLDIFPRKLSEREEGEELGGEERAEGNGLITDLRDTASVKGSGSVLAMAAVCTSKAKVASELGSHQGLQQVRRVRESDEDKQDARNLGRAAPIDTVRRRYYWRRKWRLAAARVLRMKRKARLAAHSAETRVIGRGGTKRGMFGLTRRRAPWKPAVQRARAKLRFPYFLGFLNRSGSSNGSATVLPRRPPSFKGLRCGRKREETSTSNSSPSAPSPPPDSSSGEGAQAFRPVSAPAQERTPTPEREPCETEHRAQEELIRIMLAGGSCYNTFNSSSSTLVDLDLPLEVLPPTSGMRRRSRANTAASDTFNV